MLVASFPGCCVATRQRVAGTRLGIVVTVFLILATGVPASLVGGPPADWRTSDFDGNSHALSDYRGKVVVLNFWHGGCSWCMRAMRPILALSDEFQGQPVAVLGVNSDKESNDVRRVVELFHIGFPTLRDEHFGPRLQDTYDVTMWPTTVVLDQAGEVRHVRRGYSPALQDEIGDKVRELLAEQ